MFSRHENLYFIYTLWLLFFTFLTNQYYNFNEIVLINQLDSVSYMAIARSAPEFSSENMPYHHAQRVFIPYLIGLISNFFNINVFIVFRIFTFLIIFLIIFIHCLIIKKLKTNLYFSIISISLLILNPYLIRYFIAVPTMVNDAVFILALYLFSFGILFSNNSSFFGVFFGLISRQNGVFILIVYFIKNFLNKKFGIIKDKHTILTFILLLIISFLANKYAKEVASGNFDYKHVYGIFDWILTSFNLIILLKWLILPLYSYLPAILIGLIFLKFNEKKKNNMSDFFIMIFLFISIVGVSYLPGPDLAGRNIIRQTSLAYPIFLIFGLWFFELKGKIFNIVTFIFLILIMHIWSLHPRYSNFSLFEILRNYLI